MLMGIWILQGVFALLGVAALVGLGFLPHPLPMWMAIGFGFAVGNLVGTLVDETRKLFARGIPLKN